MADSTRIKFFGKAKEILLLAGRVFPNYLMGDKYWHWCFALGTRNFSRDLFK